MSNETCRRKELVQNIGTALGLDIDDFNMVQEMGGAPSEKGAMKIWQSLLEEWNERHEGEYKEWRCIKRAYERLCKKLNARYPTEEVTEDETGVFKAT